jgi:hypothetical protein
VFDGPDPHLDGLTIVAVYAPLRADPRSRTLVARLLLGSRRWVTPREHVDVLRGADVA